IQNQSAVSRIWDYYPKHKLEVFLGMKAILMDEKKFWLLCLLLGKRKASVKIHIYLQMKIVALKRKIVV
ncbi:unnamed protein product, partial [Brassica rapa subsp. trilocularis]